MRRGRRGSSDTCCVAAVAVCVVLVVRGMVCSSDRLRGALPLMVALGEHHPAVKYVPPARGQQQNEAVHCDGCVPSALCTMYSCK